MTQGAGLSVGAAPRSASSSSATSSTNPDQASQNAQAGGTVTAANSFAASTNISAPSASLGGGTDGITARITGGTITAQSVASLAAGEVETKSHVLGAGFGLAAGVGAAIGYTSVTTAVQATVAPTLLTANSLTVNASMGDHSSGRAVDQDAVGGGGAAVAAIGAAVSVATVNNSVTMSVGGVVHVSTITGTATNSSSARATTGGGGGAIIAVGASVAQATKSSHVNAIIADNADIVGTNLTFNAGESRVVYANATAVSGGVITGNGASAEGLTTTAPSRH